MNSNTEFTTLNSRTSQLPNHLRQNTSNHHTKLTWLTLARILLNTMVKCISMSCQLLTLFSRFLWQVPLESKSSSHIVWVLQPIYDQQGPPDCLQSDRSTEFEGKPCSVCKNYKIKMIISRPYHLQSQGKIKRSHRSLRKKSMYDFINLGKKGVTGLLTSLHTTTFLTKKVKKNWNGTVHLRFTLVENQISLSRHR